MKIYFFFLSIVSLSLSINAQSIVKNTPFTNIGPSIMSGRVVDIEVNPNKTTEFYVAYASGGLWYTNNNGTSFKALTENAPTQNIGDIAIDWQNGTIWIGTGENNSSRSSYAGIGILKSTDKGKTWTNVGLEDSHHIGSIIIDSNNPDHVVIGVLGHLYSANEQRGIYKTTDGGSSWERTLFIDQNTGIVNIEASPSNPDIMYAASWERERKAWNFDGDGQHSSIYKSEDGGSSWVKLIDENSGFPSNQGVGRIGLAVFNDTVLYAFLDNQNRRPQEKKKKEGEDELDKDEFKAMDANTLAKLDDKKLNDFLKNNGFDKKHTASSVKVAVKNGSLKPLDLATYLEDSNSEMYDTPVIGAEVYKSIDGGKNWIKTHKDYLDGVYYSYGYYFGEIAVNTSDENKIYICGVPLLRSDDAGKTFKSIGQANVHSDHQAIWVNPLLSGHLVNGNDGGLNISYDDGSHWIKNNDPAVGQYYYVNVDNKTPYNVYGGLQDNGVWYGPSSYDASDNWEGNGQYPYERIGGGDGMQVQIDSRDNDLVYFGSQFGFYNRLHLKTKERIRINPKHELGDSPYRYNWQTPILLSPHNQDILYMGANKLLRSMDKGENFEAISGDLTGGGKKGNVPYGTLASISESPFQFGMIYTGSDDGLIQLTKNGGDTWKNLSEGLPQNLWVSRVIASKHDKNRVYATLNGYREDNFKTYAYVSENMGSTWSAIASNLHDSPINVIKEDPIDPNMLYLGSDLGLYISFDKGASWQEFEQGIPKVAVHDLVIQERENDLVVGTHGRSIYKANIAALQEYNKIKSKELALFKPSEQRYSSRWGSSWNQFIDPFEPKLPLAYFVSNAGDYTIEILNKDQKKLHSFSVKADKGFNYTDYDLSLSENTAKNFNPKNKIGIKKAANDKYYLPKGEYVIKLSNAKDSASQPLLIK